MPKEDPELELLTAFMIEKLNTWRKIADELNNKDVLSSQDMDSYFSSDKEFMDAKSNWEVYLKKLSR